MKTPQPFAQFWCCDLQTHSPFEPEFNPGVDRGSSAEVAKAAERFVQAAIDAGLDAIAITDHNSVDFVEPLTKAAAGKLVVYPGVEISSAEGYHLLAIFEPRTKPSRIREFLAKLGFTSGKERSTQGEPACADSEWTLDRILEEIDKRPDAIAVAPHVRRKKGLLKSAVAGEPRARLWRSPHLHAAEDSKVDLTRDSMVDQILRNEKDDYKLEQPRARVWGSDAKSYDKIGSQCTFIKMVEPTIEGLRQAFLDPGSRIRHPSKYEVEARDRIIRIAWQGGFLDGKEIVFSDQLSCLIGGKGTGKSTAVESLRYVFGKEHEAGPLRDQFDKLAENALPPGTSVTVEVARRDGSRFTLTRTVPYETEVRDETGGLVDLPPSSIIDPAILSQGEIIDTARQPRSHLALLDSFIEDELAPLRAKETEIERSLRRNAGRLVEAEADRERIAEDQAEIRRLTEAKKTYDQKGVSDRTELRRALDREERLVDEALERLEEARQAVEALEEFESPPELLTETGLPHRSTWKKANTKWTEAKKKLSALRKEADEAFAAIEGELREATVDGSSWRQSVAKKREDVARVYRELQDEYPDLNLAQFDQIDRDLAKLQGRVTSTDEADKQLADLRSERTDLLSKLVETRRAKFSEREKLAARLNDELKNSIRVEVEFLGDRASALQLLLDLRTGVRKDALSAIAEHPAFSPQRLGEALISGPEAVVALFGVTPGQATSLVEKTELAGKLSLQEAAVPEKVTIQFNVARENESPRFRGLSQLSVGQKATCILLILLAQKDPPLVVDQPEDDLDNRFVYSDVVERLRRVKDHRQLVLATHNANIPVLGDGELIAVHDTEEKGGKAMGTIPELGSIDSAGVKVAVTQILEGGRQAFRRRQEKYGQPIPEEARDSG